MTKLHVSAGPVAMIKNKLIKSGIVLRNRAKEKGDKHKMDIINKYGKKK